MAIKLSKNGKRLGRPPKNASAGKVFVTTTAKPKLSAKKPDQGVIDPESIIECEFVKVPQYFHVSSEENKDGRYMTSVYSVEDFGRKKWIVGGYLKADWNKFRSLKLGEQEIIQKCINYLNSLDYGKYGNLQVYNFRFIQKFGQEVAVVELITNERKNQNFWGEGEKL